MPHLKVGKSNPQGDGHDHGHDLTLDDFGAVAPIPVTIPEFQKNNQPGVVYMLLPSAYDVANFLESVAKDGDEARARLVREMGEAAVSDLEQRALDADDRARETAKADAEDDGMEWDGAVPVTSERRHLNFLMAQRRSHLANQSMALDLISRTICDQQGQLLFAGDDGKDRAGRLPNRVFNRLFSAIQAEINRTPDAEGEGSGGAKSDDSHSASPSASEGSMSDE